ncbi:MAG: hypothetical protein OXC55_08960 [Chloroflexi bacterium]|nr:hypothetical protein [Chloroflexota bacterium]
MTEQIVENPQDVRLLAVLAEAVQTRGERSTASWLGVDRRTMLACLANGELTPRVRTALENRVRKEINEEISGIREGLEVQGIRTNELATKIDSLGTDFERLETMIKAVRQESAKELRTLGQRVERLEKGRDSGGGAGAEKSAAGTGGRLSSDGKERSRNPLLVGRDSLKIEAPDQPTRPWFPPRDHDEIVTVEPAPDDSYVYGKAWPLVREWRMLQRNHPLQGRTLLWMQRQERLLVVEMALLHEHKLTLAPETQPIDALWRAHIMNWHRSDLHDVRRRICRRKAFRWVRRLGTFGLWWG